MKSRERVYKDGSYEVEVQRGDGQVIAAVRVYPAENNGRVEHYGVDVSIRDESVRGGPSNPKWKDVVSASFSVGRETATLISNSVPDKVT